MNQKNTLMLGALLLCSVLSWGQTPQQIQNQETFARLYGYIRYFHPSDEATAINWDRFAVYGAEQVSYAQNQEELLATLKSLFLPIAPTLQLVPEEATITWDAAEITPPDVGKYDVVAWQHRGVGVSSNSVYKSARTNRPIVLPAEDVWSASSKKLSAEPHRGKDFRLRAMVKMNPSDGDSFAQLWFRVDRANNQGLGYFYNMYDRPIGKTDWELVKFEGTIDEDGGNLVMGAIFRGSGDLWIDDFVVEVQEGDEWVKIIEHDFESDQEGKRPEDWSAASRPDLYTVTTSAEEAYSGTQALHYVGEEGGRIVEGRLLFDEVPEVGEYVEKPIGAGLMAVFPIALYGTEEYTYPQGDPAALARLQEEITNKVPSALSARVLPVRLASTIITWNVFQHFYPYFELLDLDWNEALRTSLAACYTDDSVEDFHKTLKKLVAQLKDGHGGVRLMGDANFGYVPDISWRWVEDQLVIRKVCDEDIDLQVGDIVISIAGQDPKQYFETLEPFLSAAHETRMRVMAERAALDGGLASELQLQIKGRSEEVTLTRTEPTGNYYSGCQGWDRPAYEMVEEGIHYINLDLYPMDSIDALMPELKTAKGIICDLRGYPTGRNHMLIQHLLPEQDDDKWMFVPHILYPDYENLVRFEELGWSLKPKSPHLDCPLVFLTNSVAISYAESYMGFIEGYDLATIVGQPTAGTNGNINPFRVPGGFSVFWTGMKVLKHDGSQLHGVGITPDVYVEPTMEGVLAGKDEYLEKALEILRL
ncbi:MAG TPA: peptidase S41 [Cytophagales bacterium]|nr:peptidase S41 [Cytophagales bacterium]HAP63334.1 peptidase S41 [Cytophagales bacterium]